MSNNKHLIYKKIYIFCKALFKYKQLSFFYKVIATLISFFRFLVFSAKKPKKLKTGLKLVFVMTDYEKPLYSAF